MLLVLAADAHAGLDDQASGHVGGRLERDLSLEHVALLERRRLALLVLVHEEALPPVGLGVEGPRREGDAVLVLLGPVVGHGLRVDALVLARGREEVVEPDEQAVDGVDVLAQLGPPGRREGQVLGLDGVQVEQLEAGGGAADGVLGPVQDADLVPDARLHGAHVEAVDVAPEVHVVHDVLGVGHGRDPHVAAAGDQQAVGLEVAVARVEHRRQHGLVQQAVAHPLADDDVDLVHRQRHLLHLALDQRDDRRQARRDDVLARLVDDVAGVDRDDAGGARLGAEHGQDARAAANVEHRLAGKEVLVVVDEVAVAFRADCILEHSLVDI